MEVKTLRRKTNPIYEKLMVGYVESSGFTWMLWQSYHVLRKEKAII